MLELLCIFVLVILIAFLVCLAYLIYIALKRDEFDLDFSIGEKKIIDYHKHKKD